MNCELLGWREDRLLTRGGWIGLFEGLQELFGHLKSPCKVGGSRLIFNRIQWCVIFVCGGFLEFVVLIHLD